MNQVTMIHIVLKKYWVTHKLQVTDMSSTNKLTTQKKVCCMNFKKIRKRLLGEKHLLGKPVHLSVKNTVNNEDTWRGSFSNSFSTCIGQQIQLYTSWSELKQHKFSDIGNSTFYLEEYSTAG